MRTPRYTPQVIPLALAALATLVGLALLWQLRPGLPQVSFSWSDLLQPMSTPEVEEISFFAIWIVLTGLLLLLAWTLLGEINATIAAQRQAELDAIAARILPKPTPPTPQPVRYAPPGKIPFTFPPPPAPPATAPTPAALNAPQPQPEPPTNPGRSAADNARPSISVLGPPRVTGATPRRGRLRRATEQLLVYLVLHPAGATSEELIEAIWPGENPTKTKPRLWQSAADARKVIGDAFVRENERYRLDRAHLKIDLDELEQLLTRAQHAETEPAEEQRLLERALQLYRGTPLAGADYPWADSDIRHLNARLVDLLRRAGQARLAHGDPHGGLRAAERGLALDEYNEALWRLALQAEHALGLRESVTRRYSELTRTLDEQLGLKPSQETRTIYRQLLGQA